MTEEKLPKDVGKCLSKLEKTWFFELGELNRITLIPKTVLPLVAFGTVEKTEDGVEITATLFWWDAKKQENIPMLKLTMKCINGEWELEPSPKTDCEEELKRLKEKMTKMEGTLWKWKKIVQIAQLMGVIEETLKGGEEK